MHISTRKTRQIVSLHGYIKHPKNAPVLLQALEFTEPRAPDCSDARRNFGLAIGNLAERFDSLRLVTQGPRPLFAFDHTKFKPLVEQRFALANSISADLTGQLLGSLLESGRLLEWWRQARAVWSSYFQAYPYLQTLLQPLYWKSRSDVIDGYVVCNKGFQPLKDLYISAFETIARLSVIAVGLEAIIFHHALEIPLKARMAVCPSMTSRRSRQPTSVTI